MSTARLSLALSYAALVVAVPFWVHVGELTATSDPISIASFCVLVWMSWVVTGILLVMGRSKASQLLGGLVSASQLAAGLAGAFATVFFTDTHFEEQSVLETGPLVLFVSVPLLASIVFWRGALQPG